MRKYEIYKFILLAWIGLTFIPSLGATTYYVNSVTGLDTWPGTLAQPWRTIANGVNTLGGTFGVYQAGDAILFNSGQTFNGSIALGSWNCKNGTSVNPITLGSYGTGRATISSGNTLALQVIELGGFHVTNLNFIGTSLVNNVDSSDLTPKN